MRKMFTAAAALGFALSLFSMANAGFGTGGPGGGCSECAQQQGAASDPFRKFQLDTIDLRQEMMMKRFEMQRENLKATPDAAKIEALKGEIRGLQAKIQDVRGQSGLPFDKCDGECGEKRGGFAMMGIGGCDKQGAAGCDKRGPGRGFGGGCNGGPCNAPK